jgi:hypothetical protein
MRALAIQNGLSEIPREWRSIKPKWRSPLYISKAAQADAGSKQVAAVPWLAETTVASNSSASPRSRSTRRWRSSGRTRAVRSSPQALAARQPARADADTA